VIVESMRPVYTLLAIANLTQRPHLPFLLGYRRRYRFRMDIQSNKLYPLHRPAPFACGSVLLLFRFAA
jgi:hypothetical protein